MSNSFSKSFQQLTAFLLILIFSHNFSVFAQMRKSNKQQTAANQPKQSAPKYPGAWTGIVSYTRTQTNTNDKTAQRVSGRGEDTTNWEMKYDYKARVAIIESPEKNGSSVGKASISK